MLASSALIHKACRQTIEVKFSSVDGVSFDPSQHDLH